MAFKKENERAEDGKTNEANLIKNKEMHSNRCRYKKMMPASHFSLKKKQANIALLQILKGR